MEIEVKVKAVSPLIGKHIQLPEYATSGSAGLDLRACIEKPILLPVNDRALIPTGIAIQIPSPYTAGLIFARSGLASKYGINLINGVGVIDSDYIGEIICPMQNSGENEYLIRPGDRIAQILFVPVALARLTLVDHLKPTTRDQGGFGSSGLN